MAQDTLFSKIVHGEIPADIVYQDDLVTAFRDIRPLTPTHVLVVPNRVIPTLADVSNEDEALLGRMLRVAADIAEQESEAFDVANSPFLASAEEPLVYNLGVNIVVYALTREGSLARQLVDAD